MTRDESRQDPDELLRQFQQEETRAQQGRLKIFFGASAGVGKTYAMLAAGHLAKTEGVPLTVGLVETHGRKETEAQLQGLPQLPLKEVEHRGRVLKEFDLDAALQFAESKAGGAKRPLILLDELAHSNAPGSRHPKRWQDVEELLHSGVDVWTTMNVQHLESLNDIVGGITGIRVWETVPDTLFDAADEVVVVDLPPDELLGRLSAGKVYVPEQAKRAAENFFRKGNLIALRELTLRRTADRVDSQMQSWRKSTGSVIDNKPQWSTRDALLACIGPGEGGESLVRSTARLAAQTGLPWHAVFVDVPSQQRLSLDEKESALAALKLAQELGAKIATPTGSSVVQTLVQYAREHNLSRLVIGRREGRAFWKPSLLDVLAEKTPDMDILQIPLPKAKRESKLFKWRDSSTNDSQWKGYMVATLACSVMTAIALPFHNILELTNIVMLFLLIVVVLSLRYGRKPAILAAFLGVALFDFFFVNPIMSFNVSDVQYLFTFAVMLAVALIIGQLTAGLNAQAQAAAERERRVRGLYNLSRELSSVLMVERVAEVASQFLSSEFFSKSALLVANDDDKLVLQPHATTAVDMAVAQWSFSRGEPAGRGTNTLPASNCLMLPLKGPMRLRGVLAVQSDQLLPFTPEQYQLLETCASLLAISLERIHYNQVAQSSTVQIESERLRNSLLSAISHDLRTPLAALVGLADTLNMLTPELSSSHKVVAHAIRDSANRMNAQVSNLLDMARLESGTVMLRKQWQPLEEIIGSALSVCRSMLGERQVCLSLPDDLPLLNLDAGLMERMFVNILENAAKYTPAKAQLDIAAMVSRDRLRITIEDDGPGLPQGREMAVFEKFERGNKEAPTPGVGLGLAICQAIVKAHDGQIWGENCIDNGKIRGARFVIELPLGNPPKDDGSYLV